MKEKIVYKYPILKVIREYVDLRQDGSYYRGDCKFCSTLSGTLTVFEDTNAFFCSNCKRRGDVVNFIMEYYACNNFSDATAFLDHVFNLNTKTNSHSTRLCCAFFDKDGDLLDIRATVECD